VDFCFAGVYNSINDIIFLRMVILKVKKLYPLLLIILVLTFCGCITIQTQEPLNSAVKSSKPSDATLLLNISNNVLNALKNKDMDTFIGYVDPDKGVRFTPYAYVEVDKNIVLNIDELKDAFNSTKLYIWGVTDGKGDNINLTFSDYYAKYIYDVDFINAPLIGNNVSIGTGNSIDNAKDVYKDAKIIEYHFQGFDPQYEGMDWRSLRLVFEEKDSNWYIVGVIHDQWTI